MLKRVLLCVLLLLAPLRAADPHYNPQGPPLYLSADGESLYQGNQVLIALGDSDAKVRAVMGAPTAEGPWKDATSPKATRRMVYRGKVLFILGPAGGGATKVLDFLVGDFVRD